jgi:FtsZ-binding cell division protein ZapB
MENNKIPVPPEKENKGNLTFLIVVVIVLSVILIGLIFTYFNQKHKMTEMVTVLTEEKDSLSNELEHMLYRYDTLRTNNDSLSIQIQAEKDRIKGLLALQASNAQKIRLYKKELSTLREIMKSYIRQIDSLNTKNQLLIAENNEVRTQLSTVQKNNEELEKIKDDLTGKVAVASVIQAKNIIITPLNKRSKPKDRVEVIEKIRVCFTLRENPIAPAGYKTVYLRLVRPDDFILASNQDNIIDVNGQPVVYTASREVEYLNSDIDMCIYWDNDGSLIPGKYKVELYLEGELIGASDFLLK